MECNVCPWENAFALAAETSTQHSETFSYVQGLLMLGELVGVGDLLVSERGREREPIVREDVPLEFPTFKAPYFVDVMDA